MGLAFKEIQYGVQDPLENRRRASDLTMFYKIHNGRVEVNMPDTLYPYAPKHNQQEQKHTGLSHHRLTA